MKKILKSERIPLKLWLDDLDADTMQQARNLANLPFAFHHIAIMPDAHVGYGMPIGGVLAAQGVVIPNAVGVDIGCGMRAVKTGLHSIERKELKEVLKNIRLTVPTGFKHHKHPLHPSSMPDLPAGRMDELLPITLREYESGRAQLGTLGGGNHFIEIQRGSDSHIWLMVHSGSRNIGYKVASHYNKLAVKTAAKRKVVVPKQWQLAYLPMDSEEGRRYLAEMRYCVAFARANRREMMRRVKEAIAEVTGCGRYEEPIDIAHNYASVEEHFKSEVVVHRKGATAAFQDMLGIIPGSQGSSSYIVRGMGNPESFCSCSHGAGRVLGRKQAQRILNLESEKKRLDKRNILHGIRSKRDLDEAPGAYKNIEMVMENQEDLVEIVIRLEPLAVVKG